MVIPYVPIRGMIEVKDAEPGTFIKYEEFEQENATLQKRVEELEERIKQEIDFAEALADESRLILKLILDEEKYRGMKYKDDLATERKEKFTLIKKYEDELDKVYSDLKMLREAVAKASCPMP
uniref:Uncharacterized protein n=1 Tax=viral metagenome TaxID=1070528 RepID=A0A6M3JTZ1_9ZZZZ